MSRIARVYFIRDGRELTDHPANGKPFDSFGIPIGVIGTCPVFSEVVITGGWTGGSRLTEADFGGPVTVKIWRPDHPPVFVGLCEPATLAATLKVKAEASA